MTTATDPAMTKTGEEGGLDGDRGVVQEAEGMLSVLSGGTSYDIRFGAVID
ncbi:hypothetical protein ACFVYF_25410 [Streptomyces sp. NPDC058274]|uniref:hypothetical protein n=1 Tax=Streptomyces sp. NPDC058274 TaxID=3346416 RepID=UPI0036EFDE3E